MKKHNGWTDMMGHQQMDSRPTDGRIGHADQWTDGWEVLTNGQRTDIKQF
jgi:hypothetical protein